MDRYRVVVFPDITGATSRDRIFDGYPDVGSSYAEVNMTFLRARPVAVLVFRAAVVAVVGAGALLELATVWALADVAMGLMALVNLVALVLLGRWALGALRDFERQVRAGQDPVFRTSGNPDLPHDLPDSVWTPAYARSRDRTP